MAQQDRRHDSTSWGELPVHLLDSVRALLEEDLCCDRSGGAVRNMRLVNSHWHQWAHRATKGLSLWVEHPLQLLSSEHPCVPWDSKIAAAAEKFPVVEFLLLQLGIPVPAGMLSHLRGFSHLREFDGVLVDLADEHLCVLKALKLTSLRLTLQQSAFVLERDRTTDAGLACLAALTLLTSFSLAGVAASKATQRSRDLSFLRVLTGLRSLGLAHMWMQDISFLLDLVELTSLRLLYCRVDRLSRVLERLTGLVRLDCSVITNLGEVCPPTTLTALTQLGCCRTFANRFLLSFTSLKGLSIAVDRRAKVRVPQCLTSLTSLHLIQGWYNSLAHVESLSALTGLQRIGFSDLQVRNMGSLSTLTALTELRFRFGPEFDGQPLPSGLSTFSVFPALTKLSLEGWKFLSADWKALCSLSNLTELQLLSCTVPGGDFASLTRLWALRRLDLCGCGEGAAKLPLIFRQATALSSLTCRDFVRRCTVWDVV